MLTVFSAKGRAEWHRKRWSSIAEGGLSVYEVAADHFDMVWPPHSTLLAEAFGRTGKPVRLIGAGVRFPEPAPDDAQLNLL